MKLKYIIATVFSSLAIAISAQQAPEAYKIFNKEGKAISYEKMIEESNKADVVFFGEIHNCALTHWLEFKVLQSLQSLNPKISVGMEMLEADCQLIVDEYTHGVISSDRFEDECRLWPNYSTDYEPLVYFAREHHLPLIATNVPRRYASVVKEKGLEYLDSLTAEAKRYLPPLPINYVENEDAKSGFALMGMLGKGNDTNPDYMSQAQAIKDATMAWHIAENLGKGCHMIHFNGTFHSDSNNGIIPYLLQYRPSTSVCVIRTVRQEDISQLDEEYQGLADYYICIPEDMSMSY